MREEGGNTNRRNALKTIAASAVGISGLAGVVTAQTPSDTFQADVSPGELDTGFNPHDLSQVAEFVKRFYNLSNEEQNHITRRLTDRQKQAVSDSQQPATFVRSTVSVSTTDDDRVNATDVDKAEVTKEEVNDDIADRWGWSRPAVEASTPDVSSLDVQPQSSCDANCECDVNCSDGYTLYWNNKTFKHEVKGTAFVGTTAFRYEQNVTWDAPECIEDGSGSGLVKTKGVCNIDTDIRASTDYAWAYKGEVNRDVEPARDDSDFTSYTQGLFEGPDLGGLGTSANPEIEIRGTQAPPVGEVLKSDNGV